MRSLGLIAAALVACTGNDQAAAPSTGGRDVDAAAIAAKAEELARIAAAAEPQISPRVRALATAAGAHLEGFEHRLKTLPSLRRKIRSRTRANPELTVADPDIVDALRYTVVIPEDGYAAGARALLAGLEADGHTVVRVKNYWPRGDNYSGINAVLHRDRLQWEVQFHTPASLWVRDAWHPAYELLRELDTPVETRRWLYAMMAVPWEQVDIPPGVDSAGAIHATEEIRRYPSP